MRVSSDKRMATQSELKSTTEPDVPQLDEQQREQVESRLFIPALVVHEVVRKQGDEELERPTSALAWSGLAAGLSMACRLSQKVCCRYICRISCGAH